jgi:hypothetical protein
VDWQPILEDAWRFIYCRCCGVESVFFVYFEFVTPEVAIILFVCFLLLNVSSAGLIQPTRISDDGKPVPVEHVAELLEGMNACLPPDNDDDSD